MQNKMKTNKIGIAITTHNRPEVFAGTYSKIKQFLPSGAKLVVVDDASSVPVKSDFRFEKNAGIAKAKNKCLELLEDCEHIFLFDDDCYPIVEEWHIPYIESGLNHAMFIFDHLADGSSNGNRILKKHEKYVVFENPCGCMLYLRNICLKMVGGMDERFGVWGYEHVNYSQRICNIGLIEHPFMDIPGSLDLFYSRDYYQNVERSVPASVRKLQISRNDELYKSAGTSTEYIPFKELKNAVITTYLTGCIDSQRGIKWECDESKLSALVNSIKSVSRGTEIVILSDCITEYEGCTVIPVTCNKNPYYMRWELISRHLDLTEYKDIFLVDATDVEMTKDPFLEHLGGYIYVGDEPNIIDNDWLKKNHFYEHNKDFFDRNSKMVLLNCGVVGGRAKHVHELIQQMLWIFETNKYCGQTEMLAFNMVCYEHAPYPIMHGRKVTNVFKSNKKDNKSWFKHK